MKFSCTDSYRKVGPSTDSKEFEKLFNKKLFTTKSYWRRTKVANEDQQICKTTHPLIKKWPHSYWYNQHEGLGSWWAAAAKDFKTVAEDYPQTICRPSKGRRCILCRHIGSCWNLLERFQLFRTSQNTSRISIFFLKK